MPFNPGDAKKYKKDIGSINSQGRWASIANRILKETGDESKAIRIANGVSKGSIQRRLARKKGLLSPYG